MSDSSTNKTTAAKTPAPEAHMASTAAATSTAKADKDKDAAKLAEETGAAAKSRAAELTERAKAEASAAADRAKGMADAKVDEAKSYASGEIDRTAQQIRDAGRQFGESSYQAQAADYLASNLSYAADAIRDKDLSSVADDLTQFARRNPAVFLGGAALLGFAAARLMKASERAELPRYTTRRDARFDAPPAGVRHTPYERPNGEFR
ncbi:hypothetical protein ACK8OR_15250 [Jannaschia sp. KMU-145]|uniref:hypothetical protein n=1 Tax=Jannaschia halovivens TaxID=3388667 RepID=UPI00396AFD9B